MATSREVRHHRHVIAALASGAVLSLTALTAGVPPAVGDPGQGHGRDPGGPAAPTTLYPQPVEVAPQPAAPERTRVAEAPPVAPPLVPVVPPTPPRVDTPAPTIAAPPQTQTVVEPSTVTPPPPVQTPAPAPVASPERPVVPSSATNPPVLESNPPVTNSSPRPAPRKAPPPSSDSPPPNPAVASPAAPAPAPASASATPPIAAPPPTPALAAPSSAPPPTAEAADAPPAIGGESAIPKPELQSSDRQSGAGAQTTSPAGPSSQGESPAAQEIKTVQPKTLVAPEADVQVAKASNPVEVKADPASEDDVVALRSSIDLQNRNRNDGRDGRDGPGGPSRDGNHDNGNHDNGNHDNNGNGDHHGNGDDWDHDRDHDRGHGPRQWDRDWVQYDQYYRPIICNPFHQPVRIVYVYLGAPRIVYIPPLARVVLEVAQLAAYSFTAVVDTAADVVGTVANTGANLVDAAVGTFFGGGYYPGYGQPLPPPPPPLLRYNNVPVQVRYSQDVYQPFRVNQVVDVGDDSVYGERKVLLDGVTPAWGEWKQTPDGERQFEVHRTQQYPGLDEPGQGPLPGNYQLSLASDDSALSNRDVYLMVAAAAMGVLSLGAVLLSVAVGRRRAKG